MKIGIAVHSQTGSTRGFAEAIADALRAKGHEVDIHALEPEGEVQPHQSGVKLKNLPDCGGYEVLLIGGPVWAFGMSPVALAYAAELKDLGGKRILPFATMAFPFRFMGGLQGIGSLTRALRAAGATVLPGVVGTSWAKKSDAARQALVARVTGLLGV